MPTESPSPTRQQSAQPLSVGPKIDLVAFDKEAWTTARVENITLAAYQVGRLMNCLNWAMERVSYYRSDAPFDQIEFITARLNRMAEMFGTDKGGKNYCYAAQEAYADWRKWLDSADYDQWADWYSDQDPDDLPYDWRIEPIGSEKLRDAFLDCVGEQNKAAFELGRRVDWGLRPNCLERRLMWQLLSSTNLDPSDLPLNKVWVDEVRDAAEKLWQQAPGIIRGPEEGFAKIDAIDRVFRELLSNTKEAQTVLPPTDSSPEATARLTHTLAADSAPINCENITQPDATISKAVAPVQATDKREFEKLKQLKREMDPKDEYIGQSLPILRMFKEIADFNQTPNYPILLLGPTGAGKTKVAELIHVHSGRKGKFAREHATSAMSCDKGIVREHWVGYAKGSTVQNANKEGSYGLLQQCREGTIFFDELHGTEEWFQMFLLQVLDCQEISLAHGLPDIVKPEVRMIFASNRDLVALKKEIQHDLLARLNAWIIEVPPLADRKEDVILFVENRCEKYKYDSKFLLALLRYDWPENVRELEHVLEKAKTLAGNPPVELKFEHLAMADVSVIDKVRQLSKMEAEAKVMQFLIQTFEGQGLEKGKGLYKRLAEFFGITQSTLCKRLDKVFPKKDEFVQ